MKNKIIIWLLKIFSFPIFYILERNNENKIYLSYVWKNHLDYLIWIIRHNTKPEFNNFINCNFDFSANCLKSFEDLTFLFNSNYSNRGIVALDFDEAGHIFKTIRTNNFGNLLEIGRFLGGSTLLIGVAKSVDSRFVSVDLKVKAANYADDSVIEEVLSKSKIKNVDLVVDNSQNYKPDFNFDFVFIDGDHSYEGVKKDYLNISKYLNDGAHVLFHDAVAPRKFTTMHEEVNNYMKELSIDSNLFHLKDVGSIRHFIFRK